MADAGLMVRAARAVLAWSVPAWARDGVRGDLDEELARVTRERGRAAASRWYLREAVVLSARYLVERRHGAPDEAAMVLTHRNDRMTPLRFLGNLARDLRLAGRQAVSHHGFWLSATLTLGIAIGFNAAIFSLVNAVLFKPLARDSPDRVVRLYAQTDARPSSAGFSYLDFRALKTGARAVTDVSAVHLATLVLSDGRASDQLLGEIVSGSYFELLGVPVAAGRPLMMADDSAAAPPVALLSEHYWRTQLGAEPAVLGRPVRLSGRPFTIVGIVSEDFRGHFVGGGVDVWLPLEAALPLLGADAAKDGTQRPLQILARLGDGVSRLQAGGALGAVAPEIARNRRETGVRLEAVPGTLLHGRQRRMAALFLSLFTAMVGLVLLIAASNVANLLLARMLARRREMAIRMSIGAGRLRIVQQLTAESLLLAAGGLVIALSIAWSISRTFRSVALLPGFDLRLDLAPDARVFAATTAIALLAGLIATLLPSLSATRGDVVAFLREGGPSLGSRSQARLRAALVVAQIGLAVVVCVAAGLLTKSGRSAAAIDLGFDTSGIFATDVDLDVHGYTRARAETFYRELLTRVIRIPGVAHATLASRAPLDSSTPAARLLREGEAEMPPAGGAIAALEASYYVITGDYFAAVGVPLVAGRSFTDADRAGNPPIAVANEFLVRALWPGLPPPQAVGRRLRLATAAGRSGPRGELEIVGIARNAKYRTLGEPDQPHLYLPYAQHYSASMTVLVRSRTQGIPAREVQAAMATIDPAVQGFFTRTLEQHTRVALLPAIFASRVSLAVGLISALLGAIGLYALVACVVAERRREFGLRMALGAPARRVLIDVVRHALVLSLAGCAAGAIAALLGAQLLSSFLYGVSPMDPATYAVVIAGAASVAAIAAWIPARRAARVDPAIALRS